MAIDYAAAKREHPRLKAMLTRAGKDPVKVKKACLAAMKAWDRWGAWPDDWARWERALGDSLPWGQQITLRELELRGNPAGKPRRSVSLAYLVVGKKKNRRCPFCSAVTDIDRLDSIDRTWQQWRCPECQRWVDRPEASRRNPSRGQSIKRLYSEQDRIGQFRKIVNDRQAAKVDGLLVDLFSASAIVAVYDGLNETNRSKYARMPIRKMCDVAFKLLK